MGKRSGRFLTLAVVVLCFILSFLSVPVFHVYAIEPGTGSFTRAVTRTS